MMAKDWYKALDGYESARSTYKSYLPCMTAHTVHVDQVMLGKFNSVLKTADKNPLRTFIVTRPQCSTLSEEHLRKAIAHHHMIMCPFAITDLKYKPDFKTIGTCAYDDKEKRVYVEPGKMCPEGHRCACPINGQWDLLKESMSEGGDLGYKAYTIGYYTQYALMGIVALEGLMVSQGGGVMAAIGLTSAALVALVAPCDILFFVVWICLAMTTE